MVWVFYDKRDKELLVFRDKSGICQHMRMTRYAFTNMVGADEFFSDRRYLISKCNVVKSNRGIK